MLGAGGAARACVYALKKEGAGVTVFVRDAGKAAAFAGEFGVDLLDLADLDASGFDIVINATPVGMRAGEEDQTLLDAGQVKRRQTGLRSHHKTRRNVPHPGGKKSRRHQPSAVSRC